MEEDRRIVEVNMEDENKSVGKVRRWVLVT